MKCTNIMHRIVEAFDLIRVYLRWFQWIIATLIPVVELEF